uniref:Uncharacterized protein n=1 Tax=Mastacembelus armatus TaxID=205130 RepID=A0A3Q3LC57_9TELE
LYSAEIRGGSRDRMEHAPPPPKKSSYTCSKSVLIVYSREAAASPLIGRGSDLWPRSRRRPPFSCAKTATESLMSADLASINTRDPGSAPQVRAGRGLAFFFFKKKHKLLMCVREMDTGGKKKKVNAF